MGKLDEKTNHTIIIKEYMLRIPQSLLFAEPLATVFERKNMTNFSYNFYRSKRKVMGTGIDKSC
jgi:hypothetical protein